MAELRKLQAPASPNLPIAPTVYAGQHFDILNNVLRLYFNQLDQNLKALFSTNGGKYLSIPHIAAQDSTDQYATASNTPTKVLWDTLDSGSGFTLNANSSATAQQSGIYKIDYSLQLANTANSSEDVSVWLRVNGVDVAGSMSRFTLPARKSAGVFSYAVAYSSVAFAMNTNDFVELYWSTTLAYNPVGPVDGAFIESIPAQTTPYVRPAAPSAIGTITFVSALTA
jgi:hypothetical protein